MIVPDASKRTVRLAVRIEGGAIVQLDRNPLPKIKDGAVGDLVLLASDIAGEADRKNLQSESFAPLLPEGAIVFVALSPGTMKRIDKNRLRAAAELKIAEDYCFAEVRLEEVLVLRRRGYKDPCLEPCRCFIPALKRKARSLNHAFTLLSTEFETERISHSGNVFERAFYWNQRGFRPLNEARGRIELSASGS